MVSRNLGHWLCTHCQMPMSVAGSSESALCGIDYPCYPLIPGLNTGCTARRGHHQKNEFVTQAKAQSATDAGNITILDRVGLKALLASVIEPIKKSASVSWGRQRFSAHHIDKSATNLGRGQSKVKPFVVSPSASLRRALSNHERLNRRQAQGERRKMISHFNTH